MHRRPPRLSIWLGLRLRKKESRAVNTTSPGRVEREKEGVLLTFSTNCTVDILSKLLISKSTSISLVSTFSEAVLHLWLTSAALLSILSVSFSISFLRILSLERPHSPLSRARSRPSHCLDVSMVAGPFPPPPCLGCHASPPPLPLQKNHKAGRFFSREDGGEEDGGREGEFKDSGLRLPVGNRARISMVNKKIKGILVI